MMKKTNPLVSVVIPCFNDKEYIKETIQSILKQTFQDFEIIIVDDGSNDATKQVLQTLINNKIKVITQENKGLSAARNVGFKKANGEYVLTIDSDDTVEHTFLEKAIPLISENMNLGAVSSYVNVFDGNYQVVTVHKPRGGRLKDFLFDNNSVSFALIRKKAWAEVSGYDENMRTGFEDWEFWISLTKKGWEIGMIKSQLFNYRSKVISMSKVAKENYRESNLNYIYKKHQDIYTNYFPEVIDFLTNLAQRHKRNEIKYKKSLEYCVGKIVVWPLRKIEQIFKMK